MYKFIKKIKNPMKIAVIGAGIFGVTIAIRLAKNHQVELYEKNEDIMMAASDVNNCRVHKGYHYPRSNKTVQEVLEANQKFSEEYNECIMNSKNYVCVAKKDSLVSGKEYLNFCDHNNLKYKITDLDLIDKNSIEVCLKIEEYIFDHKKLKEICKRKLENSKIKIHFNSNVTKDLFKKFDLVVICTYGITGDFLDNYPKFQREYQFEVCEKVFVKLPKEFLNKSILVMDGPFMSIDPVGNTGIFTIGDVENTVLQRSTGVKPIVDAKYLSILDKGIIKNPPFSNSDKFIESGIRFMPELKNAEYIGSSFCIKTTLANVDDTDERPTIIDQIDEKTINVFSGKIPTCVNAANKVEELIKKMQK